MSRAGRQPGVMWLSLLAALPLAAVALGPVRSPSEPASCTSSRCCADPLAAAACIDGFDHSNPHHLAGLAFIERTAFAMLRPEDQARVRALDALAFDTRKHESADDLAPLGDAEYALVADVCSREVFDRMAPVHQRSLVTVTTRAKAGLGAPAMCFAPDAPEETIEAFNSAVRFQQTSRWFATAHGATGSQGSPITLTYSFVPDGTAVNNIAGFTGTSELFTRMNALYGTPAVWQALYAQTFARWGQLCNVTYVLEPNDDGVNVHSAPGVLGVRGDMRMAGMRLDGNSGVLAYNNFPDDGDMVIDTQDNFYDNLGNNSHRLRNILAHEHGHGLGMLHVCPRNTTKLMEPFITLAFDGPQFDEILNGQRHYGDTHEPNDNALQATPIADIDATTRTVPQVSIDGLSDTDWFAIDLTAAPRIVTLTARPLGSTYLQGAQTSACDAGASFDALAVNNLIVELLDPSGVTLLASADAAPAGQPETLELPVFTPGVYLARIRAGNINNIQAYDLDYSATTSASTFLTLQGSVPAQLSPGVPTSFSVRVQSIGETITGAPLLHYRSSPAEEFAATPLTQTVPGSEFWTATLPPFSCASSPAFFVTAEGSISGTERLPAGSTNFTATVGTSGTIYFDDVEMDRGWTFTAPGDNATTGIWVRANPSGTFSGGIAVQPETTTSGSLCFITGASNAGAGPGTADVDGGKTSLTSPLIDCSMFTSATVSYQRWYTNSAGDSPDQDVFRVFASIDNGNNWVLAETVGPSGTGPGWVLGGFSLGEIGLAPSNQLRVRFVAEDADPGSIVEAAIDDFRVTGVACVDPPPTGSCCLPNNTCSVLTQAACSTASGSWTLSGACTPMLCAPPTGACCISAGTCAVMTEADCADASGDFLGVDEPCLGDTANPITCCTANFDEQGGVNATDIFVFLDAWFSQNGQTGPDLSADMDSSGDVAATDIFVFLDAWFAGCS